MIKPITINIAVEDLLSEVVIRKIIVNSRPSFDISSCYGKSGYDYLKRKIRGFNNASKGIPFVVLADLESECAPNQIREWLPETKHPNFLFRIAVKEVESWLLADRVGIASFLGINIAHIPVDVDVIADPKSFLISLARRSRKTIIREGIVPVPNTTAIMGPDYNGTLSSFVAVTWEIERAMQNSDSLRRTVNAINNFKPTISGS
ncbi:MAG: hypothetical protein HW384_263 [Dehalococcoidia bacterium]|nr:hypothetical protein [Dehalococcoidia bacterium]